MSDLTRMDVAVEAAEKVHPVKEKFQKTTNSLFVNAAVIMSLAALFMTVVLYSNQLGVCKVYSLPQECIELDLKKYLPLVKHLCGIQIYILFYVIDFKTSAIMKKYKFSFLRVFWGFSVVWILLTAYHLDRLVSIWGILAIAIIMPIIDELLYKLRHRPFVNKAIAPEEYQFAVESEVYNATLSIYEHKGLLNVLMVIILAAPFFGTWVTKANTQYQVCDYNNSFYAVVMDYPDKALLQHADEKANVLTIDTSSYQYIDKTDVDFIYKDYDSVVIK